MSDYKEELSALVEKIKQVSMEGEYRRIAKKLEQRQFCVTDLRGDCINNCIRHIEEWLRNE